MIAAIVHQLTRDLSEEEIKKSGFDAYFVDHTTGVYPVSAGGIPYDMKYIGVKGDVFADLNEDLAAEQKARVTYDNLLRLIDDPDVCDPIKFLREREIVHYQRFGEAKLLIYTNFNTSPPKKADPELPSLLLPAQIYIMVAFGTPLIFDGSVYISVTKVRICFLYTFPSNVRVRRALNMYCDTT